MKRSPIMTISVFICFLVTVTSAVPGTVDGPKEVEQWFQQLSHAKQKVTKLHFYFHDFLYGPKPTDARVATSNTTNTSPTYFGFIDIIDNPLTSGPKVSSRPVGYMQGLYGSASLEEVSLSMAVTLVFTDGMYNGSTLAVMGQNTSLRKHRELAIVGGTGVFRLASGVVTLRTYYFDVAGGNATVEVNVVALHY